MSLSLDSLKVTSFEVAPAPALALPTTGGEDCFSHMAGCPPVTFTG